jgi:hypothetical protein
MPPNELKVLSMWEPWASLVAGGYKRFETRSWATSYRGPVVIHATKMVDEAFFANVFTWMALMDYCSPKQLPLGCAIAIVDLMCIHEADAVRDKISWRELHFGNYESGRKIWEFQNVRRLPEPVPMRGHQWLFSISRNQYPQIWESL